MSQLLIKQQQFAKMIPSLLSKAFELGYEVKILECQRTKAQANANAEASIGISRSLHLDCLAIDLALFKGTQYLTEFKDYLPLGEFWESIGGSWGGRFHNVDSDHFSLMFNGVR